MPKKKWFFENLKAEALRFKTKREFRENSSAAYLAATRNNRYDEIVSHMPKYLDSCGENGHNLKWSNEVLREEALKFKTRGEFQKRNLKAYRAAKTRGILDEVCAHMKLVRTYWTNEMLRKEAFQYFTRSEFALNSPSAYVLAKNRNILDEICSHMENSRNSSKAELNILDRIKNYFPKAQKLNDRKVKIENRPNIHGFEIDIYVPELRKGIEFDGTWSHSFEGLKRGRPNWSDEELLNYHSLKDSWFASKGIAILHIKEEDWNNNKTTCITRIEEFLEITGFMSELEQRVA